VNLYAKQLELQKDSILELEERYKKLIEQKDKQTTKSDREVLYVKLIKKLSKKLLEYKKNNFKEVVKKLVNIYQDELNDMFKFSNKNIQNFISTPLSVAMIETKEKLLNIEDALQEIKKKNNNFANLTKSNYKKIIDKSIALYSDSFKDIFLELKEKNQFSSALIFFLTSNKLAYILTDVVLQIQAYENEKSEDFNALSRQNRADELFLKIKKSLNIEIDFIKDKQEQLIAQELIDLLIELDFIEEENKEEYDYTYLKTTNFFEDSVKDIKHSMVNIRARYKPMVVPPTPWSDIDNGGFLKDNSSSKEYDLILIKHNINNRLEHKKVLQQKGKIPQELLSAINNLQNTPFKINKYILELLTIYNSKLKFDRYNQIDKKYYNKILYYKEYIKANKINSLIRLEEILLDKYENIAKSSEDFDPHKQIKKEQKYYKIVFDNKDNNKFWIEFEIEHKLAKLQNSLNLLLEIADEFKEFEQIYFVWQIDFRGRVYPVQTLLNPQGGDIAKSLLLFDKEQKLNERGVFWFKVHGANLYGEVDKEIFEKRIEWIESHKEGILNSAKEPLKYDFWKKADEPFEFLAFCFEYQKYIKDPNNFYTSLPVAIDGSNNGLQHISTLLRDIESAKKVNVLPTGRVEDIYKFIAQTLQEELKEELENFNKIKEELIKKGNLYYKEEKTLVLDKRAYAKDILQSLQNLNEADIKSQKFSTVLNLKKEQKEYLDSIEKEIVSKHKDLSKDKIKKRILRKLKNDIEDFEFDIEDGILSKEGEKQELKEIVEVKSLIPLLLDNVKIDRKFVKKPVMTDSYGSSTRGKAKSIFEDIKYLKDKIDINNDKEKYSILRNFSNYLATLIENAIAKNSPASVNYEEFIKQIATKILKKDTHIYWITPINYKVQQLEFKTKKESINLKDGGKITIHIFKNEIDKKAHKSGILPNFIHSLDATHLYKTVNSCQSKRLKYFMTVHDSFATLPNDMDTLSQTLKEEFINLYNEPILEDLVEYIKKEFDIKTKKGTLDVPYIDKESFELENIKNSNYFFA